MAERSARAIGNRLSAKTEVYRYFAFISYSSKDAKIAKSLQRRLETYKLPTTLRNELEAERGVKFPKRLSPIFRDMTDLEAGVLGRALLRELEDSKFLIVVCSPNSATSAWVNQEVENFILMGRYDRIVLYIVDGEPNASDPSREAFPPILRRKPEYLTYDTASPEENAERRVELESILSQNGELKGLSTRQEGPRVAFMKTVARILELKPDDLIQREKRRRLAKIRLWTSGVALTLALIGALSWRIYDRNFREHVGYYADYVERWGVPEGIFPLERAERDKRSEHYRIYKKAGLVRRLEHVDSAGTPIPIGRSEFQDRPTIAVYEYSDDDGQLTQARSLDRNGRELLTYQYSGDNLHVVRISRRSEDGVDFNASLSQISSIAKNFHDFDALTSNDAKSEIGQMRLERDASGFVISRRYQRNGVYDGYVCDSDGVGGFRYKLDELGRVVETIYLDVEGN
ncbi:MAG: toll/interleukin-1 receptor domain-containing protein, partial [Thermoguttaceae bacterium]|nr:toll/interleukin-1 receptor domain-containing protein [Thermoguttaceae bacterium]